MPLQKSFSEQSRFPRQRQDQWRKSKTYAGAGHTHQAPPPRPPIPASATTKSKLQQFQYSKSASDGTPGLAPRSGGASSDPLDNGASSNKSNTPGNRPQEQADSRDGSYSTPVSRLAWQDLMGAVDVEDQNKNNTSPDERLEWHNGGDESDATISPIVPRRAKKRARSSSPVASPAMDKHKPPAVNVSKLKQALQSPDADPALDLWDRFVSDGPNSKTPLGVTNPALAQLMVSSSPRPPKMAGEIATTRGGSNLRRAMSCGTHWPKRRRVDTASESGLTINRGNSKSSMVNALLETVNDEINKSDDVTQEEEEEEEEEEEQENIGMDSPSFRRQRSPSLPEDAPEPAGKHQQPSPAAPATMAKQPLANGQQYPKTPIWDYGDDDFGDIDESTLWELDASLLSCQAEVRSPAVLDQTPVAPHLTKPGKSRQAPLHDDFDDLDDDLDDALLVVAEEMMADIAENKSSANDPPIPAKAVHLDGRTIENDDLYGDDFGGDFDFEAVELAATQSAGHKAAPIMPVRSIR
ncbi:hypothetical protein BD289DRAFT_100583 [Coniella lustricola]|uniref:Uncharacterized protein n=1 Tax=Coniella lustricola TaxID=2025994 RepID=A0A2T3AGN1_9PEZI|nr:hypothetical protein BD289DRAFT_100583 [Coniella lustricola]